MRSAAAALTVFCLSALSSSGTEGKLVGTYAYDGDTLGEKLVIKYAFTSEEVNITFSCNSGKNSTYLFSYLEQGPNEGILNMGEERSKYIVFRNDFEAKCPKWGQDVEMGDLASFWSTETGIVVVALHPENLHLKFI